MAGPIFEIFLEASKVQITHTFFMVKEECAVEHNLEFKEQLALIVHFDEEPIEFEGKNNKEELDAFLLKNTFPYVIEEMD